MTSPASTNTPLESQGRLPGWFWILVFAVLACIIAYRLGATDLWATVELNSGESIRIPNTYATVDHPFHATRADTLLKSLADGEILRWIANHQGGYPVEFYPLGAPWMEVIVWALFLGTLPIMVIHKLVVIAVFLLPFAGFALLARADRLPLGVAVLAIVLHVSVRGWWWSGGYMELLEWGLLTNVAAAAMTLVFMTVLYSAVRRGSIALGVPAAIVASLAVYTNVRSIVALAVVGVAVMACCLGVQSASARELRDAIARILVIAGLSIGLLSPLALALTRFRDLYYFVSFSGYGTVGDYWHSTVRAVSTPVLVLTVVGLIGAWLPPAHRHMRLVSGTLVLYMTTTVLFGVVEIPGIQIDQLEATRLMPFQRLLMMYLASYGAFVIATFLIRRISHFGPRIPEIAVGALAAVVLMAYLGPLDVGIPKSDQATSPLPTTGDVRIAELESAVRLADDSAVEGTALLVLGTQLSWHDQLWSPQWSERAFFYDDWLWYWQTDHIGTYNPLTQHSYPDDASTLSPEYLETHGIGAVVVTGEAMRAAESSPRLTQIASGTYDVYTVDNPTTIVTGDAVNATRSIVKNQLVEADFQRPAERAMVRRNNYPRWTVATGQDRATLSPAEGGYMSIAFPDPQSSVELEYEVDVWDWVGRVAFAFSVVACVALVAGRRRMMGTAW